MATVTNDSSTSTGNTFSQATESISSNIPPVASASNESGTPASPASVLDLFYKCLEKNQQLEKNIRDIQSELNTTQNFFKNSSKLAKTSQIAIIILMIIPILQLLACTAIVYYLGIQDNLPSLLTKVLSGVSLLSFVEVVITIIRFSTLKSKVEEIEKRLDRLDKE